MASKPPLTPQRAAQLRKNPGTRSKLPASMLTPAQRAQRQLNTRLDQPVVPGSTLTQRGLAREGKAAVQVRYGPQEAALTGQARDQPGWYDEYKAELAQHQQNVAARAAATNQAVQSLAGSVRGLDQQSLAQQQQASAADAATRGATPSAQVGQDASNASVVRQGILASLGANQAARGANATSYADTLAHVVAPGQKLQAAAGTAQKLQDLKGQEGAYRDQYQGQAVANELKNVLAGQALGLNATKAAATIENQQQSQARARGRAHRDSARLTLAQQKDATQRKNKTGPYAPKVGRNAAGQTWLGAPAQNKLLGQIHSAQHLISSELGKAFQGVPDGKGGVGPIALSDGTMLKPGDPLTSHAIRDLLITGKNPLNTKFDPVVVNAAMDLASPQLQGLSAPNVKALHGARLPIRGRLPLAKAPKAYTQGPQGQ